MPIFSITLKMWYSSGTLISSETLAKALGLLKWDFLILHPDGIQFCVLVAEVCLFYISFPSDKLKKKKNYLDF